MTKVRVNWGPNPQGADVRIFSIVNSSHNHLLVLAYNRERALQIGRTANHYYQIDVSRKDRNYPYVYDIDEPIRKLKEFCSAIELAIGNGMEGTLHLEPDGISLGEKKLTA